MSVLFLTFLFNLSYVIRFCAILNLIKKKLIFQSSFKKMIIKFSENKKLNEKHLNETVELFMGTILWVELLQSNLPII